ncbi:MAG: PAS domain S-box protein, partial [Myxococcales bacterium]|nr:PAS domain S-box protein [Myxococcales bacterium]
MYDALFNHIPIGILVVAPTGAIRFASPAAESMFGFSPGELTGVGIEALVPLLHREAHVRFRADFFPARLARQMGADRELLAVRKNGSEFPVEVGLFPSPRNLDVFATVIDVSERQDARETLRDALRINKTGTWRFDLEQDEVVWSPELFRILRLPEADRAPPFETHHELFKPESWARLAPAVARAAADGIPYELELELAAADDEGPRIAVARCEPKRNGEGKVIRLVGTFQDVTELVRARRQRNNLLDRLAVAKAAAGLGIWEWDIATDELVWDERMYELYGLPRRPVTYRDWRAAVHPADIDAVEHEVRAVLDGDGQFRHKFRVRHGGGERHIQAAGRVHLDPNEGTRRMVGVNMDITESALTQERLGQRDAHLALVMHSLPDAVFTVNMPDRRIEFVNDEVENILGYTPRDVIGRTTRMFYADDRSYASFGRRLSESLARGDSRFRSEELLRRKDGRALHCEVTVTFKRAGGELVGVISTVRSIEERWQAQQLLRERQEQWDRFSAATSNMLWNWNLADDSVERNVAFQSVFGYTADEVDSSIAWWVERLHPDDRARVLGTFERALETGQETTGYTYRFRCRDGRYASIRDRVFLMRDEEGRVYRALGAMEDITEQTRREEETLRNNNLESLGLLAGGIAHDFNNQLTSILARAELLELRAADPDVVRRQAAQIIRAVESASRLTGQLLTFSKGGGTPIRQAVSIEELAREHVTFSLRGSATQVSFRFEAGLWSADVDPGQIGQVIQNLVLNADQAMAKGGALSIAARNLALEGQPGRAGARRYLELRITDSGPGIPADVVKRIFDPYFT